MEQRLLERGTSVTPEPGRARRVPAAEAGVPDSSSPRPVRATRAGSRDEAGSGNDRPKAAPGPRPPQPPAPGPRPPTPAALAVLPDRRRPRPVAGRVGLAAAHLTCVSAAILPALTPEPLPERFRVTARAHTAE